MDIAISVATNEATKAVRRLHHRSGYGISKYNHHQQQLGSRVKTL
jgi:hypothetical protein